MWNMRLYIRKHFDKAVMKCPILECVSVCLHLHLCHITQNGFSITVRLTIEYKVIRWINCREYQIFLPQDFNESNSCLSIRQFDCIFISMRAKWKSQNWQNFNISLLSQIVYGHQNFWEEEKYCIFSSQVDPREWEITSNEYVQSNVS